MILTWPSFLQNGVDVPGKAYSPTAAIQEGYTSPGHTTKRDSDRDNDRYPATGAVTQDGEDDGDDDDDEGDASKYNLVDSDEEEEGGSDGTGSGAGDVKKQESKEISNDK